MNNKMNLGSKNSYLFLGICGLMVLLLFQSGKLSQPYFTDEIGYWAAGAWMNGIDWSSVMSKIGYYGYGYGIFLAPLFLLKDPQLMYYGTVIINALMVSALFLVICLILKELASNEEYNNIIFSAFIACCYSYVVVYTQLTMCEICLTLFTAIYIYLMITICKKVTIVRILLLSLVTGYLISVHLRSLILVIISAICFVSLLLLKKIRWSELLMAGVSMIIVVAIVFLLQGIVVDNIYTDAVSLTHNDYNDNITEKIGTLDAYLNLGFVKNYFMCLIAKIFYLSVSSFFLFDFCVVYLIRKLYLGYKTKNEETVKKYVFLTIFLLIWILYSAFISGKTQIGRIDNLMYGRYIENIIPPFLAIGILEFLNVERQKIIIKYSAVICLLGGIVCYLYYRDLGFCENSADFMPMQISGLAGIPNIKFLNPAFCITIYASIFVFILVLIFNKVSTISSRGAMIIAAICWLIIGYNGLNNYVYNTNETTNLSDHTKLVQHERIKDAAQFLDELGTEEIYYIHENIDVTTPSYFQMFDLQFDLSSKSLEVISYEDFSKIPKGSLMVINSYNENCEKIIRKIQLIYKNNYFYIGYKK